MAAGVADGDPYAQLDGDLDAFAALLADFFGNLADAVPVARLRASIESGSAYPVLYARPVQAVTDSIVEGLTAMERRLVGIGFDQGLELVPGGAPATAARGEELVAAVADPRAEALGEVLVQTTEDGVRKLILDAAREYQQTQSMEVLRRLEANVRASIGLTPKQVAKIDRWRQAAEMAEMDAQFIEAEVKRRAEAGIALRARGIADRGVIEEVSLGRHESWVAAMKAGEIPTTARKQWVTQSDNKVRPLHRAQAAAGPIPLNQIFSIMGVMTAPSRDAGCRCHCILVS